MNAKAKFSTGLILVFSLLLTNCNGQRKDLNQRQNQVVGGPFENGDFFYIGMPQQINSVDTSVGWSQKGQKLMITGTIYQSDGKTPAPDVILYYYHTDTKAFMQIKKG